MLARPTNTLRRLGSRGALPWRATRVRRESAGSSRGGRTARLRGTRSLREHNPRPERAPPGWRTVGIQGAHNLRRPHSGGFGLGLGRTPCGAHPPRPLPGWPGAARRGFVLGCRLPTPPESPPSPGGKKKTLTRRGLRVCRKGQPCETQGEGLSFDKLEKPLDRV